MTVSGEPPRGAGDLSEPDWIDQILERANRHVDAGSPGGRPPLPIVPDTDEPKVGPETPTVRRAPAPVDGLAEIRWADETDVTPAGIPIAEPAPAPTEAHPATSGSGLVPEAVGRSAWDSELATLDGQDPDGWDKLSWQDLDDGRRRGPEALDTSTTFGRLLREWGPVLLGAVVIAMFVRLVLVQAYHIPSASMVPTLENGDRVVVNRLSYQFGEVERGQVVVFAKPAGSEGENDLIKRVIGLPGETIRFVDNQVYIDGRRVEEPYLLEQDSSRPRGTIIPGCAQETPATDLCEIPDDHVFMMGDNRRGSSDSRVFGPVPIDSIVGRAFVRVWPLNHLGQL